MRYRTLGNSGCAVSELCLGTMTFGNETDEEGAHAQLDRFVEAGGNFVDTADVYTAGASEEIIGRWLATRPARGDRLGRPGHQGPLRDGARSQRREAPRPGTSPGRSTRRCARLGVEAVDLYQVHAWDPWTPLDGDAAHPRRLRAVRQDPLLRVLQLHRVAADQGGAHRPRPRAGCAGDAAAAVQPDRPRDRVGDRARRTRRGSRPAAVEPAGRRLAHRQVPARPAADGRDPARRGPGARHGGLGAARHRAHLADHRGGRSGSPRSAASRWRGRPVLGHQPPRRSPRPSWAPGRWSSSRTTSARSTSTSATRSSPPSTSRERPRRPRTTPYGEHGHSTSAHDRPSGRRDGTCGGA